MEIIFGRGFGKVSFKGSLVTYWSDLSLKRVTRPADEIPEEELPLFDKVVLDQIRWLRQMN